MKQLAIAFALLVAACGGKSSSPTTGPDNGNGADGTMPAGGGAEVVTLVSLDMADTSCGVSYTKADGTEAYLDGDFELCEGGANDATGLIGQQVTFTTEMGNVLAAECEGDMDCGKSDNVEIVMHINPAAAE